jgi:hypothetical protein
MVQGSSSPSNMPIIIKHHHHHQNPSPNVTSSPKSDVLTFQGQTLGKVGLGLFLQGVFSCLQRKRSSSSQLPRCGSWHPICGIQAPMKAQARLVPPKTSIKQGPAKTSEFSLQGSQVKCIMPSKITFNTRAT